MGVKNKQNDFSTSHTSGAIDDGNNPKGVASLKQTRDTKVNATGTAYLRSVQHGLNK